MTLVKLNPLNSIFRALTYNCISYNIVTVKSITEKVLKRVKEVKMTYAGCQAIGINAATKEVEIDSDFMEKAAAIVS